jgi:TolB protein
VVRADGRDAHRLDPGPVGQARWSPVADRLAFGASSGAVVVDADGSNRHDLPGADIGAWSPDGAWLAYARVDLLAPGTGGEPPRRQASLWIVRADGSQARKLLDAGTPSDQGFLVADWSPDGKHVLYWTDPGFSASLLADGTALMAVPVAGGQPIEVVDTMLVYRDAFQWSADGSRLAVVEGGLRMAWENKAIAVTSLGGSLRRLSDAAHADVHPAWSPDGRWIAYSGGPAAPGVGGGDDARRALAQRRIWLVQADGSARRQLTNADRRDEWPRWSADGSYILFVRFAEEDRPQLWLMRADGTDARVVLDDLTNTASATTQPPLWFGFYGSTDWSRLFDWWQGPAAQP